MNGFGMEPTILSSRPSAVELARVSPGDASGSVSGESLPTNAPALPQQPVVGVPTDQEASTYWVDLIAKEHSSSADWFAVSQVKTAIKQKRVKPVRKIVGGSSACKVKAMIGTSSPAGLIQSHRKNIFLKHLLTKQLQRSP